MKVLFARTSILHGHIACEHQYILDCSGAFFCAACGEAFAGTCTLHGHITRGHSDYRDLFRCVLSELPVEKFSLELALCTATSPEGHSLYYRGFDCTSCGEVFTGTGTLQSHIARGHSEYRDLFRCVLSVLPVETFSLEPALCTATMPEDTCSGGFPCCLCGETFARTSILLGHIACEHQYILGCSAFHHPKIAWLLSSLGEPENLLDHDEPVVVA